MPAVSGLPPAAPAVGKQERNAARDGKHFVLIVGQLALLLAVFWGFNIEGPAFSRLAACAFLAFLIHYLLPFRLKKAGFVLLSLATGLVMAVLVEAGAVGVPRALVEGALLIASLLLVGFAVYQGLRLPLPALAKVGLLLVMGGVLAYLRTRHLVLTDPHWRILGAIFMFRTIVYAYDVVAGRAPQTPEDFLSYFFLLPSFHFTLFPVVDYTTFRKSFYSEDIHVTAARGIELMLRGTIQLGLYRLVYHRLVIEPEEVRTAATLSQYLFAPYLLYLRVSGQFHVITGMLHLFGYRLPDANRNYFLAESFTDFWRRINIYWKDFMVKVFYFPVYFRVRRRSEPVALVAATAAVFAATTLLHGYQLFWLQGGFVISHADLVFWGILGVLVALTVLREARSPASPRTRPRGMVSRAVSTAGVFVTISVLWSMWSNPPPREWLDTVLYWR